MYSVTVTTVVHWHLVPVFAESLYYIIQYIFCISISSVMYLDWGHLMTTNPIQGRAKSMLRGSWEVSSHCQRHTVQTIYYLVHVMGSVVGNQRTRRNPPQLHHSCKDNWSLKLQWEISIWEPKHIKHPQNSHSVSNSSPTDQFHLQSAPALQRNMIWGALLLLKAREWKHAVWRKDVIFD